MRRLNTVSNAPRRQPGVRTPGVQTPRRQPQPRTPGTRTPTVEDDDEYAPSMVSQELQQRLQELVLNDSSGTPGTDGTVPPRRDTYTQSVDVVSGDRAKTSTAEREKALLDILLVLTNKYEPQRVSANLLQALARAFLVARSDIEAQSALQAVAAGASFVDEDHPDFDRTHEILADLLPRVLKRIQDGDASTALLAHMTTAYAVLSYFLHFGGSGFASQEISDRLIEVAEQTTAKEAPLTVAALMGLGLTVTLLEDADFLIVDLAPGLPQFLHMTSVDVQLAAAKVTGLFFEKYTGSTSDIDANEIAQALEELLAEAAKRTARKDKRGRKSVVRDVLRTVRHETDAGDDPLTHFALSRNKSLQIRSWRALIVVQHLKWVFGAGLHSQIANNPLVGAICAEEEADAGDSITAAAGRHAAVEVEDTDVRETVDTKRDVNVRQARLDKLEKQGLLGGPEDDA